MRWGSRSGTRAGAALFWTATLLASWPAAVAQEPPTNRSKAAAILYGDEEKTLVNLERRFMRATQDQDRETQAGMMASDFTVTRLIKGMDLSVGSREQFLSSTQKIRLWYFHETKVRLLGDVAAVASRVAMESTTGEGQERGGEFLIVNVWVKSSGSWKLSARYTSVAEPAEP